MFLAMMLLTVAPALAYTLRGKIVDESGEPMYQASVRLLAPADSSRVKSVATTDAGSFTIGNVADGKYILEVTYIGYEKYLKNIVVKGKNQNLGSIALKESALSLKAVTVTGVRPPIVAKEDTLEFTADSYKTAPNAAVEDVLKRLPGVEVASDGSITSNGKKVSKILVDGKEFFADDPKVASKNLPANMVDKVQVVDRKSDLARLTGVDDGEEETVINLTVKKGMKNGWFGNVQAGYGTDERYKGSFNVNRFWNDNQITFLGNINNINQLGFSDGGSGRFMRFGGTNGITISKNLGLNFNVGNGEIFRVGGNILYSDSKRNTWEKSDMTYFFNDSTSRNESERNAVDRGHNFRADFRMLWKPDSATTLEFRPNFSYNENKSWSTDYSEAFDLKFDRQVNRQDNRDDSRGKSYEAGGRLIFNRKLAKPGRAISLMANYRMSNVREKSNSFSWMRFFLLPEDEQTEVLDQYINNHTWMNSVSARFTWTEPLGNVKNGNFLTLSCNFSYRWNNADKLTYDRPVSFPDGVDSDPVIGTDLTFNEQLSNRFRNDYMNQDIRVGYKHVSKKTNLEGGISLVPQMSKSENLIDEAKTIPARHTFNVAPYLRFRYRHSKTSSANIRYQGRSSQPSLTQLQPVADVSNPLNIVVGNPDLKPTFTHNLNFRYQNFNQEAQRAIMFMGDFSLVQNSIVSRTTTTPGTGGRSTTYENVNGVWSGRVMNMISFPFRDRRFTINNHLMGSYNHNIGFTNGERNRSGNLSVREMLGIAFRPESTSIEVRPFYSIQHTSNSIETRGNNDVKPTVHSWGVNTDITYYTPFGLVISTDMEYSKSSGYSQGFNSEQWLWNASLSYQFLRDRSATISLSAYDILGKKSTVSRTSNEQYQQDRMFNTLSRYFMVTLSYKFNSFGKGNEPADRNRPRWQGGGGRPPMGPPPGGGRPPM